VEAEMAAMAPGTVQLNIFRLNKKLEKYVKAGQPEKALQRFQQLQQQEGMSPDTFTFVHVLNACASLRALGEGRRVHEQIVEGSYESNVFVGNSLVDMYPKCGSIEEAWTVFHKMPLHDVVSWNVIILGHVRCGQGQRALELFQQMQQEQVQPMPVTFVGVLNACASVRALEEGRCVHEQFIQSGCKSDVFVENSLVDMYAKCGSMEDAWVCSAICPCMIGLMDCHDIRICKLWARGEGIATIPTNATGRCAAKPCHFLGGTECMHRYSGT
jgi:pentatricopeptide repeat protein